MKKAKADSIYTPEYIYWSDYNDRKEALRLEALKRGENAPYGYWRGAKQCAKPIHEDQNINTIPFPGYKYRLEITYKQANEAIEQDGKDALINLFFYDKITGKLWLTPKQAKHLKNGKLIRDINGRLVLKWRFKYYLII